MKNSSVFGREKTAFLYEKFKRFLACENGFLCGKRKRAKSKPRPQRKFVENTARKGNSAALRPSDCHDVLRTVVRRDEHAQKHQRAARQLRPRHSLVQNDRRFQRTEHGHQVVNQPRL